MKMVKADRTTPPIANAGWPGKNEDIEPNKLYGRQTRKRLRNPALAIAENRRKRAFKINSGSYHIGNFFFYIWVK